MASEMFVSASSCSCSSYSILLGKGPVSQFISESHLLADLIVAFAYSSEVFPLFNREAGMSWAVFINLFFAGKFPPMNCVHGLADQELTCLLPYPPGILTLIVPQAQVSTDSSVSGSHGSTENATLERNDINKCNATVLQDSLVVFRDALNGGSDWADTQAKLLGAFVGFGTLSFILIFLFVPETKLAAAGRDSTRTINYISLEELNHIFKVHTRDFIRWQFTEVLPYEIEIAKYIVGIRRDRPDRLKVMHRWAKDRRDDGDNDGNTNAADEAAQRACAEEVEEVQRAYNPGPNDSRRTPSRQQRHHQGAQRRAIHESEDNKLSPLIPPNPMYQQPERAGSRDWHPSTHPSAEESPPPSTSHAGSGNVTASTIISPPGSRDGDEETGELSLDAGSRGVRTDAGTEADGEPPRSQTRRNHADEHDRELASTISESGTNASSPHIRRKPLPQSS